MTKTTIRKKIFYLLPVLTFVLTIENVFIDIQFQKPQDPYKFSLEEGASSLKKETESAQSPRLGKGILEKIYFFSDLLKNLKDENSPSDGKPEKTITKLERVILSQKIGLLVNLFLTALSISAIISFKLEAYFFPFLNRVHSICSIFLILPYLAESSRLTTARPILGIFGVIFFLSSLILAIWAFKKFGKFKNHEDFRFLGLYHASKSEEENMTKRKTDSINFPTVLFHFLVIILTGMLIGNFLYIPLFSLQKNYSAQFGILLALLFLGLSLFYIKNYYVIGKENSFSNAQNILASISFLQFRFVKNILFGFLSLAGVVFFITLLFSLLAFNSFILKSANFLLHTQVSL